MRSRNTLWLALTLALGASMAVTPARAEELSCPPGITAPQNGGRLHLFTPYGASVGAGGGVGNFVGQTMRALTSVSGTWNARASFGTRSVLGLEAAYVGGVRSITAPGLDDAARLVDNGLEGTARVNLPIERGYALLEPFVFAGAGWARYSLFNTPNGSANIADYDNVVTVPFGAGFAFGYRGFIADARFTYRGTFNDGQLVSSASGGGEHLQSWMAGATLGMEF